MTLYILLLVIFFAAGYVLGNLAARKTTPFVAVSIWVVAITFAYVAIEVFSEIIMPNIR